MRKNISKYLALVLLSPLLKPVTTLFFQLRQKYRKIVAIKKAKFLAKATGYTHFVFGINGNKEYVVVDTRAESLLRKKKNTKRWSFAKLQKGCIFTAKP